jgi:hypothetical protein
MAHQLHLENGNDSAKQSSADGSLQGYDSLQRLLEAHLPPALLQVCFVAPSQVSPVSSLPANKARVRQHLIADKLIELLISQRLHFRGLRPLIQADPVDILD